MQPQYWDRMMSTSLSTAAVSVAARASSSAVAKASTYAARQDSFSINSGFLLGRDEHCSVLCRHNAAVKASSRVRYAANTIQLPTEHGQGQRAVVRLFFRISTCAVSSGASWLPYSLLATSRTPRLRTPSSASVAALRAMSAKATLHRASYNTHEEDQGAAVVSEPSGLHPPSQPTKRMMTLQTEHGAYKLRSTSPNDTSCALLQYGAVSCDMGECGRQCCMNTTAHQFPLGEVRHRWSNLSGGLAVTPASTVDSAVLAQAVPPRRSSRNTDAVAGCGSAGASSSSR